MLPTVRMWFHSPALRRGCVLLLAALGALLLVGCDVNLVVGGALSATSWSPDGAAVAYRADDGLHIYDVATKQSRALDVGEVDVIAPAWSPDGKAIAFYAITRGEQATVDLRAVDPGSGRVRILASDVWPIPRQLAPDQIQPGTTAEEALYESQQEAVLFLTFLATISWSPEGAELACTAGSRESVGGLIVDYASGTAEPIVTGRQTVIALAWSPDGKALAYTAWPELPPAEVWGESAEGSESEPGPAKTGSLWVHDFATSAQAKLYDFAEDEDTWGPLVWSADSNDIGFVISDRHNEGRAIGCVVEAKPGAVARQRLRGLTEGAVWAPGLRGAAFTEKREGDQVVLIYVGLAPRTRQVLGTLPRPTSTDQEVQPETSDDSDAYFQPAFSPDGRRISMLVGQWEAAQVAVFSTP